MGNVETRRDEQMNSSDSRLDDLPVVTNPSEKHLNPRNCKTIAPSERTASEGN